MAQKYVVELIDDLDGSEATTSITFAVDGVSYAIDLSDQNAGALRSTLEPYVSAARKADGISKASRGGRGASAPKKDLSAVREWASKNGHTVSGRGRIPTAVMEAYDSAH